MRASRERGRDEFKVAGLRGQWIGIGVMLACCLTVGCRPSDDDQFWLAVQEVRAGHSTAIDLNESPMADDSPLGELRGLDELTSLNLDRTPVTDEGLAAIGKLPNLQDLSLTRTRISNAGIATIVANFPELVSLRIDETVITDAGFKKLADAEHLVSLS